MWQRRVSILLAIILLGPVASNGAQPDAAQTASTPAVAAERGALLPTEPRRTAELETAFPDDAVVWLGEGEDRALGVYRDVTRGKALGVVVIVLASGMSPDAHADATALRRSLPRARWATLAVALPDVPDTVLPPRQRDKLTAVPVAAADPKPTSAAIAPNVVDDPLPARVRVRLNAAVKAAREKGSKVVVLGEDAVGAWLAWAQNQQLGADAMIAINTARNVPRIDGKQPKESLAALESPALLLIEAPLDWSVDDRLAPGVELHRLPPGRPAAERLDRQIRGWLKRRFGSPG